MDEKQISAEPGTTDDDLQTDHVEINVTESDAPPSVEATGVEATAVDEKKNGSNGHRRAPSGPPSSRAPRPASALGDLPDDFRGQLEAIRSQPDDDERWNAAEETAAELERPEELAELYREFVTRESGQLSTAQRIALGTRAVDFHDEWFADPNFSIALLQHIARLDPDDDGLFERLTLLLTTTERWDALLAEYDRALEHAQDDNQRINLLQEAARIARDFASQNERASDYLIEQLLLTPKDEKLAHALERRLELQGRHADLIKVWTCRLGVLPETAARETKARIGKRQLGQLSDAPAAFETARQLLQEGANELGCALLEEIGANQPAPVENRREALGVLRQRLAEDNQAEDVIRALELSLPIAEDTAERVQLHAEAAGWLRKLGKLPEAIEHLASILALTPDSDEAQTELNAACQEAQLYERYASALLDASDRADSTSRRLELLLEAARVRNEVVEDKPSAIELYARALDYPEAAAEHRLKAATVLTTLLVDDETRGHRLEVLEKLADLEPELEDKARVLGEAAALADELGQVPRALADWQKRRALDPSDIHALDAKIQILRREGDWNPLIEELTTRARLSETETEKRRALVEIAQLYEGRLSEFDHAITAWKAVRDVVGPEPESTDALVRLLMAVQDFSGAIELLNSTFPEEGDPARKTNQLAQLGTIYQDHRADNDSAVDYFARALAITSTDETSRTGLGRMLYDPGASVASRAAETLAKAFEATAEWSTLLDLIERRLDLADAYVATLQPPNDSQAETDADAGEGPGTATQHRESVLMQAARIYEHELQDKVAALDCVKQALALRASVDVESELIRLSGLTNDWQPAVDAYAAALETADPERCIELLVEQGQIFEQRLDNLVDALGAYREILRRSPGLLSAALATARLAGETHNWADAAAALVAHSRAAEKVEPQLIVTVEGAMRDESAWQTLSASLEDMLAEASRANNLVPQVLHDLLRQSGIWLSERVSDDQRATQALRGAVAAVPDPDTLARLATFERREPGPNLVKTLLALGEHGPQPLAAMDEAARVAIEHHLDDAEPIAEQALEMAARQLGSIPEAEATAIWTINELVARALGSGRAERGLELLVRGASLEVSAETRIELCFRCAQVAARALGDATSAIGFAEQVREAAPQHAGAIALLDELYESTGKFDSLLALREAELGFSQEVERRVALRLDMSRVLGLLDRSDDERLDVLGANLKEVPGHLESVDQMAQLLTASQSFERLFELFHRQASLVEDIGNESAAAALWARAARCARDELSAPEDAIKCFQRSVDLEPTVDLLDALAELHIARDDHAAAVTCLEHRLDLTGVTPKELLARRATVVKLANSLIQVGRISDAQRYLTTALGRDEAADEVRQLLAQLYREQHDYEALAPLLAEGVAHASSVADQVAYLRETASVHWRKLDRVQDSITYYRQAVELDAADQSLQLALADTLGANAEYAEAQQILESLLEGFGRRRTKERAHVHYHLAKIAKATGDLDRALKELDAASSIERSDPSILHLLGEVARSKGQLERAEKAYRTLLLILGRKLNEPGASLPPAMGPSAILFELSQIASGMDQPERSKDLLDSALEAASEDSEEARRLEEALRESDSPEVLLKVIELRLASTSATEPKAETLCAKADVLLKLGRAAEAVEARLAAFAEAPDEVTLRDGARQLAEEQGQMDRFVGEIRRLADAEATSPELKCDLWLYLGQIAGEQGNDQQHAENLFKAQATGADAQRCLTALEELFSREDKQAELAEARRQFADNPASTETPERLTEVLYQLAEYDLCEADRSESGAAYLRRALDLSPDLERATFMLERSVRVPTSPAVELLEDVARRRGDDAVLLVALKSAAKLDDVAIDKIRVATTLAEELEDEETRLELLQRTTNLAQTRDAVGEAVWAYEALAKEAEASGNAQQAVELLHTAIKATTDEKAFELTLELAKVTNFALGRPYTAAKIYEKLLSSDPGNSRVWKPLLGTYRQQDATSKLIELLLTLEKQQLTAEERRTIAKERVRLAMLKNNIKAAERALKELLKDAPDDEEASALLVDLLERQGKTKQLTQLLEKLFEEARNRDDSKQVCRYAVKLGNSLSESDADRARSIYQMALPWATGNREVLEAMLALYSADEHPAARADVLEHLLKLEQGEPVESIAMELVGLRQMDGDSLAVVRALEIGYQSRPDSATIRNNLFDYYRREEQWDRLATMLRRDAENLEDQAAAIEQLEEAAKIQQEMLNDPREAAEALAYAQKLDPSDLDRLRRLTAMLKEAGHPEQAIEAVTGLIEGNQTPEDLKPKLMLLRGAMAIELPGLTLDWCLKAVADFERCLKLGVDSTPHLIRAREHQREISQGSGDHEHEREALKALTELLPKNERGAEAVTLLESWSERHPDDTEMLALLGQMAFEQRDFATAARAYENLASASTGEQRAAATLRFADACEKNGQALRARDALEAMYRENPGEELRARLRQLYEAANAHADLARLLINEATSTQDDDLKFDLLCDAGELFLRSGDDSDSAFQCLEEARSLKPKENRVLVALAEAYTSTSQLQEAANLLSQEIATYGRRRSPALSQLQYAMARVARAAGDTEALLAWLEAAMQSDRQNGVAAAELAELAMEGGQHDLAVKALQVVTLLKTPGPMPRAEAYLRQAIIANTKGDKRKAALLAKRAVTTDPNYEDAKEFLDQLG